MLCLGLQKQNPMFLETFISVSFLSSELVLIIQRNVFSNITNMAFYFYYVMLLVLRKGVPFNNEVFELTINFIKIKTSVSLVI